MTPLEHRWVLFSCVGLVLDLDAFPCRDAVMFFRASDESERFPLGRVRQEIVQLFRTELSLE